VLLEFSCSNYKSIRERVLFSMLASSDTTHEDEIKKIDDIRILKSAVIYGANGSGKSNFINAVSFVKQLVMGSVNNQPGQGILQSPHKLSGLGTDSSYQCQFIVGGVRYVYGFTLVNMLVREEYLYYAPNNRQAKIFERKGDEYTVGSRFRGKFNACKDVLKPNRLLLSCAANFSSVEETEIAYRFFSEELIIYSAIDKSNWMPYSLRQIKANPQMKKAVIAFLSDLGTEVKDIAVNIDKKKPEISELPPFLSEDFKKTILESEMERIAAKVQYEKFSVDLQEESTGIQKLFEILCPIIDIMTNGKVLLCDELESSLHESLVYGILKLFIKTKLEKFPQLIFTTHDTSLLSLDLFRRDQIWFTELKGTERTTDLYSLAEIKNVRKDDNLERGYISGKYGAIPMLNLNFANRISSTGKDQ